MVAMLPEHPYNPQKTRIPVHKPYFPLKSLAARLVVVLPEQ